ncbi:protein of unknown function [Candidatus Hydrogenisulfobacillus filiaventi]|uniref:Uncharacterized protein n=1 Tax=Candidatus Hydrogenisulfobacillus filiaventi TaxID=2707344 RepID=A0A6F8ZE86_9FIRM|nr:protein of unknown function [Candidatus Hydrogenisulfobacillus filiaventi]
MAKPPKARIEAGPNQIRITFPSPMTVGAARAMINACATGSSGCQCSTPLVPLDNDWEIQESTGGVTVSLIGEALPVAEVKACLETGCPVPDT